MNNKQSFYKILIISGFATAFLLTTMGSGTLFLQRAEAGEAKALTGRMPTITVSPAVVKYEPGVSVLISGSGFEPNQKLGLRIVMGHTQSDIRFLVKPQPVPNDLGAFAGAWTLKREISRRLIEPLPQVYTLWVVDKDGKTLCTAPLLFCDPKAEKKSPACTVIK